MVWIIFVRVVVLVWWIFLFYPLIVTFMRLGSHFLMHWRFLFIAWENIVAWCCLFRFVVEISRNRDNVTLELIIKYHLALWSIINTPSNQGGGGTRCPGKVRVSCLATRCWVSDKLAKYRLNNYTNAQCLLLLLQFLVDNKNDIRHADDASNLSWRKSNNDPYILSWTADRRLTILQIGGSKGLRKMWRKSESLSLRKAPESKSRDNREHFESFAIF